MDKIKSMQYRSDREGGWHILPNNHLLFLKFNFINKPSIYSGKLCYVNILLGMLSLAYMIIPPQFLFLSKKTLSQELKNIDQTEKVGGTSHLTVIFFF